MWWWWWCSHISAIPLKSDPWSQNRLKHFLWEKNKQVRSRCTHVVPIVRKSNDTNELRYTNPYRIFYFFIPFIIFALLFSLLVVTQIRGHIAGSFPPLPTTVRALHFYREKISALSSLVDSRGCNQIILGTQPWYVLVHPKKRRKGKRKTRRKRKENKQNRKTKKAKQTCAQCAGRVPRG